MKERLWLVSCEWTENSEKNNEYWEIESDSMEEAFQIWQKKNWERLFDPYRVKILKLRITQLV